MAETQPKLQPALLSLSAMMFLGKRERRPNFVGNTYKIHSFANILSGNTLQKFCQYCVGNTYKIHSFANCGLKLYKLHKYLFYNYLHV